MTKIIKLAFYIFLCLLIDKAYCQTTTEPLSIAYAPMLVDKESPAISIFMKSESIVIGSKHNIEKTYVFSALWHDGTVITMMQYGTPLYKTKKLTQEETSSVLKKFISYAKTQPTTKVLNDEHINVSIITPELTGMWDLGSEKNIKFDSNTFFNYFSDIITPKDSLATCSLHFSEPKLLTNFSGNNEVRAAWITRSDLLLKPSELETLLLEIKNCGINTVFVNIQSRGFSLYSVPIEKRPVLVQDPELNRNYAYLFDWLIPTAKKHGLKVVAWGEYGFYGIWSKTEYPTNDALSFNSLYLKAFNKYRLGYDKILAFNPDLESVDSNNKPYLHVPEFGYYRIYCPSNPKTHDALISFYREALSNYSFDGLNLDRIRYPNDNFCHCSYCKEHFKKDTGIDLVTFDKSAKEYEVWNRWRADRLNEFMAKISTMMRTEFPGKELSVCVAPHSLKDDKAQQWTEWIDKNYVDYVIPLLSSSKEIESDWSKLETSGLDNRKIVLGFIPWKGIDGYVDRMRLQGFRGYSMWVGKTILFYDSLFRNRINKTTYSPN